MTSSRIYLYDRPTFARTGEIDLRPFRPNAARVVGGGVDRDLEYVWKMGID